jgi:hypothetical protein
LFAPEGRILGIGSVAEVEILAAITHIDAAVFYLCTSCSNKGFPLPFSLLLVPVMATSVPRFADLCRVGYKYRCKLPLTLTIRVSVFERAATSLSWFDKPFSTQNTAIAAALVLMPGVPLKAFIMGTHSPSSPSGFWPSRCVLRSICKDCHPCHFIGGI